MTAVPPLIKVGDVISIPSFQPLKGNDSRAAVLQSRNSTLSVDCFNPSKEMTAVPPFPRTTSLTKASSFNPSKEMTAVPPMEQKASPMQSKSFNPSKEMTAVPPTI